MFCPFPALFGCHSSIVAGVGDTPKQGKLMTSIEHWTWVYTADSSECCVVEAAPHKAHRIISSGQCHWVVRPVGIHWDGSPVRSSVRNAINRRIIKNKGRVDD